MKSLLTNANPVWGKSLTAKPMGISLTGQRPSDILRSEYLRVIDAVIKDMAHKPTVIESLTLPSRNHTRSLSKYNGSLLLQS